MTHSKTPGGTGASEKFLKKDAQAHGLGADNAPAHKEGSAPGERPVASDSGTTGVGIENKATNVPGTKGVNEPLVSSEPQTAGANMK